MFPIRDNIASNRFPIVNTSLIVANIIAYLFEVSRSHLNVFVHDHGLIASRFVHHFDLSQLGTSFSSMFMHASAAHIFGNLWILYIFGDNVEDRLGRFKYLWFYLLCGLIADFVNIAVNPNSTMPVVGASGAIAGVMAAYFVLYPKAEVQTQFLLWYPMVRAWIIIGGWFLLNCICGYFQLDATIGWFAHIGGFMGGAILVCLLTGREDRERVSASARLIPAFNWITCTLMMIAITSCNVAFALVTHGLSDHSTESDFEQAVKKVPKSKASPKVKTKTAHGKSRRFSKH
ncbi:MAG: rhomboid family intramembrane serine protease [Candidatus Melainabacteria bacterium]|nr:rhomboid family intramembrane serine protease [Candidatus Melainabacteria bacterium]